MIQTNLVLDAKGLACPMPIVQTKKAINNLEPGQVLEVQATDKGSTADIKMWAERVGHYYLGTIEDENILKHYIRKSEEGEKELTKHEQIISNEELQQKLDDQKNITVIDVREAAEYAFGHIPGTQSIPLGELEDRIRELDKKTTLYVICRSGNRSDVAAQKLAAEGFENVFNVVPGMSDWNGKIEKNF